MASQKQIRRHEKAERNANSAPQDKYQEKADHGLTDELLDEIDELLAQENVIVAAEYLQQGGE